MCHRELHLAEVLANAWFGRLYEKTFSLWMVCLAIGTVVAVGEAGAQDSLTAEHYAVVVRAGPFV